MGISLFLELPAIVSYWVVTVMCFVAMGVSTMFVVQIYTLVQTQTPPQLVGKIMATLVAVAMCGHLLDKWFTVFYSMYLYKKHGLLCL